MNAYKRQDLLAALSDIAKCDGKMDTSAIYRTFCEALRELLAALPNDETVYPPALPGSDHTSPAELP